MPAGKAGGVDFHGIVFHPAGFREDLPVFFYGFSLVSAETIKTVHFKGKINKQTQIINSYNFAHGRNNLTLIFGLVMNC